MPGPPARLPAMPGCAGRPAANIGAAARPATARVAALICVTCYYYVARGQISRPEVRATVTPITRGRRSAWPTYLRVSTRFISTIAAALGIIFILSGLLVSLPRAGSTTAGSAPVAAPSSSNTATRGVAQTPQARAKTPTANTANDNHPKTQLPQPVGTATSRSFSNTAHTENPVNTLLPLLDPSTIEGRMVIGVLLFILGILGVIFTRRRQVGRTSGRP